MDLYQHDQQKEIYIHTSISYYVPLSISVSITLHMILQRKTITTSCFEYIDTCHMTYRDTPKGAHQ